MRQQLQQEENYSPRRVENKRNEDETQDLEDSHGRDGSRRTEWFDEVSNDLLKSM